MSKRTITRDTISSEALFILGNLRENGRLGRSNKLADVKATLEPSVSIEFDSYFFFLRKFHYIAMDREAQLRLTEQGERVVNGELGDKFGSEVGEFFADQLPASEPEAPPAQEPLVVPPPPPEVILDETEPTSTSALPPPLPRVSPVSLAQDESPPIPGVLLDVPEPAQPPAIAPPATQLFMPAPAAPQAAPTAAAAPRGAEVDLRYQKFDPLGSGPLGTVYKGRFSALGLDVCLKELKDIFGYFSFLQRGEVLKRLKKELCAQAQVRHPAVVQVMDQNTDTARPYYVLEMLGGGNLKAQLEAGGGKGVPVASAVRWFLQLAYGLRAAHQAGLTHHNLKPENVLFDGYGNAKLADFGLGRAVEVDAAKGLPQVFVGAGGMVYLAPELINRASGVEPGPAADVYGLGILLYEMLTGQIPGRRSPLPSEVNDEAPAGLDALFDKMTQDKVEQRYPDMDALLEDFYKAFPGGEHLTRGDLILSSEPK